MDPVAPLCEFSGGTKERIEARFGHRCAFCMAHHGEVHKFCHILDSDFGSNLHANGSAYNLILKDFSCSNPNNGVLLCPTCHLYLASYAASPALLSFIPCPEILRYLTSRLVSRDFRDVDAILAELASDPPITNEAVMARPFIDMYTILQSVDFRRTTRTPPHYSQATQYLPPRLILDATSHSLIDASDVVSPGTNVYRVFDAATIPLTAARQDLENLHLSPSNRLGVHHDGSRLYWKPPRMFSWRFLDSCFQSSCV
ncbi:hypothetical protein BDZ89DRAFT_1074371 [Hymenopellis radicata]|nr:hypothetical protein BDZ89DRAFT_1074371 [Hymenopellis radicata]